MIAAFLIAGLLLASDPPEELFDTLKEAESAPAAAQAEADILAAWMDSGSPTVDLLMSRAKLAEEAGALDKARAIYDRVVLIEPGYSEAWFHRAGLFMAEENYSEALRDLNETLTLEPRHFEAWTGLGALFERIGGRKQAIEAYQRALDVHPNLAAAKQAVQRLKVTDSGNSL